VSPWEIERMMMQQAAILTHAAGGRIIVTSETMEQTEHLALFKEPGENIGDMVFRVENTQPETKQ
jgi:hypothetical protein